MSRALSETCFHGRDIAKGTLARRDMICKLVLERASSLGQYFLDPDLVDLFLRLPRKAEFQTGLHNVDDTTEILLSTLQLCNSCQNKRLLTPGSCALISHFHRLFHLFVRMPFVNLVPRSQCTVRRTRGKLAEQVQMQIVTGIAIYRSIFRTTCI